MQVKETMLAWIFLMGIMGCTEFFNYTGYVMNEGASIPCTHLPQAANQNYYEITDQVIKDNGKLPTGEIYKCTNPLKWRRKYYEGFHGLRFFKRR